MPSNQTKEIKFVGFWYRVIATLLDMVVLSPLLVLNYYNIVRWKSILIMIVLLILLNLYKPYLEYRKGATIGKMLMEIKVVNERFERITLEQSIIRSSPWIAIALLTLFTNFFVFNHADFESEAILLNLEFWLSNLQLNFYLEFSIIFLRSFF